MKRFTCVGSAIAFTVLAVAAALSAQTTVPARHFAAATIAFQEDPPPVYELTKPGKDIIVGGPIAFTITEHQGEVTHVTRFLLVPNYGYTAAKGHFTLNGDKEVEFILDQGFVYVKHEEDSESPQRRNARDVATRPHVRTGRVLCQGKGTTLIVQILPGNTGERVLVIEGAAYVDCIPAAANCDQEPDAGEYVAVASNGSTSPPAAISGLTEAQALAQYAGGLATQYGFDDSPF